MPTQGFEGLLTLDTGNGSGGIEALTDTFSIAANPQLKLIELPPFSFEFVSDGPAVIPVKQTPQRGTHPYWEIILVPGRAWHDPADGQWNRVALPFALKEKNQNCTHNGVMSFAYQSSGEISQVSWQISAETCLYLKVNLWGSAPAGYRPGPVDGADKVVATRRSEVSARMPVTPISQLSVDYPQVKMEGMKPRGVEDASIYGFVVDGTHYRSGCPTRHGPYPFCDDMVLPSYSLAKSIFAGLYYLHMTLDWPEFADTPVSELVPECRLPDGRWDDVSMSNLINMTTGNYDQESFGKDEEAEKMQVFFLAESHAEKIRFSCEAWPKKSEPGSVAVYHTTDDYILGAAMTAWVRRAIGPELDIHRDFLYPRLLEPLALSPLLKWTQRTYDEIEMPFTAYGLVMKADDLARIATAINSAYNEQMLFEQQGFEQALFRDPEHVLRWFGGRGEAYRNGFWGVELSETLGCEKETWIPFMSGYGGIVTALIPNGTTWYYFSDSNIYSARSAMVESNKVKNYCRK